jgi:hypothetical protein
MARDPSIQSAFLEAVKQRLAANVSFADELGEILNISRDSAYRRIRGETVLSLEEAQVLYNRFGISLDELFSNSSQMLSFHRRVVNHQDYNLEKWLNSIYKNLDFLSSFSENEMIYSAKEIPIFHYFRMPELSAFKHFFWMKTLIGYPEYENKKYSRDAVPKEALAVAEKVWAKYASLSTTEIWNEEAIYDTLKQIEFYQACGFFKTTDQVSSLCDELIELLNKIQTEASVGVRPQGGTFNLYNNEILIADNTVFARMKDKRCVYVNYNALNLLLTFQEPFCSETEAYLKNLIKKSILISTTAERERNRFFNNMRNRVTRFRENVHA